MNNLTVLEDSSPYFIRFTHSGLNEIISDCEEIAKQKIFTKGFTHHIFESQDSKRILDKIPFSNLIELNEKRVSLFITNPGYYYRAHKDGLDHRFSINYTVKILDQDCVTSWYSDDDLKDYPIDNLKYKEHYRIVDPRAYYNGISREVQGFVKANHVPVKTMIAKQGECILFNTDIFHDFDNSRSINQRIVLTLRSKNPKDIYFEDIKKILFNNTDLA